VSLALGKERAGEVETSWQDSSVFGAPSDPLPSDPQWSGHTVFTDLREKQTTASPAELWRVIEGIGGDNGWYSFPLAWAARGWADKLVGGVGLRRGRRNATRLGIGEALDWWRVEELDRGRFLRLRAEMRVPGPAWLELTVTPDTDENGADAPGATYRQRAVFFPKGLGGRLYWFSILPFHGVIFAGMARRITLEAEKNTAAARAAQSENEKNTTAAKTP